LDFVSSLEWWGESNPQTLELRFYTTVSRYGRLQGASVNLLPYTISATPLEFLKQLFLEFLEFLDPGLQLTNCGFGVDDCLSTEGIRRK
jgi:hypothetical protein